MPQRDDFYNATNCAILMEPAHGGGKTKPMTVADFAMHPEAPQHEVSLAILVDLLLEKGVIDGNDVARIYAFNLDGFNLL